MNCKIEQQPLITAIYYAFLQSDIIFFDRKLPDFQTFLEQLVK